MLSGGRETALQSALVLADSGRVEQEDNTPLSRLFLIPILTSSQLLVKKNLRKSCTGFCNLKSLPPVVSMVDVVKFGTSTVSY